jgi:hypothetical protein
MNFIHDEKVAAAAHFMHARMHAIDASKTDARRPASDDRETR